MRIALAAATAALLIASPVRAESELERGFAGALRGCEEWVLNPKSWANGIEPFVSAVGLGDKMGLVKNVDEAALPPKVIRVANHYWRINSTNGAGFILVVSDRLPMCHITGGGDVDLQPTINAVLAAPGFASRWKQVSQASQGEMLTTVYRNREEPAFSLVVSRAEKPGQRLDRVQVLATATFAVEK
ncbi:MAG TPA: hypothetical protein VJU34_12715 [Phenylobacterium sp.]|nr:hypothetical protein [Phenylobacterium sp.]